MLVILFYLLLPELFSSNDSKFNFPKYSLPSRKLFSSCDTPVFGKVKFAKSVFPSKNFSSFCKMMTSFFDYIGERPLRIA